MQAEVDKLGKPISIVIRTKNEERWITQCLREVFNQDHKDLEVIIVDNESTDKTLDKARQFPVSKVLSCADKDYRPGKALNIGAAAAKGDHIIFLSGHCIPVNEKWLSNLLANFNDQKVAGVYGRQEPMAFTSDLDKRDLALVFGLDRREQVRDSFFHNANSMIRRDIWQKIPFDESVTNIEDRVWAKKVLEYGYKIIYEPEASAYHYHGIHQNGNVERCTNVVKILEHIHPDLSYKTIDVEKLNIVAIIPVKGPVKQLNGRPLADYTITRALESKYIKRTIVSTDDKEIADIAVKAGAQVPFLRDPSFSREHVDIAKVYQYSLEKIEEAKIFPDIVVCLEITFPFRRKGLLDDMIMQLAEGGFDSIIAAKRENKGIWRHRDEAIVQIEEGITPRQFKDPTFIELRGVGCVTHAEFIRGGSLLGEKIGIYDTDDPYSHLEIRDEEGIKMASHLIKEWF